MGPELRTNSTWFAAATAVGSMRASTRDGGERFHLTSRVLVRLAVLHVDNAYNAVPSDHWSGQKGFITVFS